MSSPRHPLPALDWLPPRGDDGENAVRREWLITNGLGGYASGTVANCSTRRHHGLLTAALPGLGRVLALSCVEEQARVGKQVYRLDGADWAERGLEVPSLKHLTRFGLDGLVPSWEYRLGDTVLRRTIVLVHGENTLFVIYTVLEGGPLELELRPFPHHRVHDQPLSIDPPHVATTLLEQGVEMSVQGSRPALKLRMQAKGPVPFVGLSKRTEALRYRVEAERGYPSREVLCSPGFFSCEVSAGSPIAFGATLGGWELLDRAPAEVLANEAEREHRLLDRCPEALRAGTGARLALATDQFIIEPTVRPDDEAWARATGQDARSVIAGYPWFTDWGRDTMISLEGLTLLTGRSREAAAALRTFRHYVRDGLVPNFFPEGDSKGVYHTADATLWFFHALDRTLDKVDDRTLLSDLWPALQEIVEHHLRGTRFNIGVDPRDGLLTQGADGYQLTWMDAKVDGWVVTPRRGKAVEINALWFNALALMADWAKSLGEDPALYLRQAELARSSFNQRFWNPQARCLFDVVDGENGDDAAVRPNQVFAMSLHHPVLMRERWNAVLDTVREELLTPVGLRTLSMKHPDFKATYDGDLRSRDAAYHQGTVWPWLLGHYVDAVIANGSEVSHARALLAGLEERLHEAGMGTLSEIFDATAPHRPRGCVAQAWSVAEVLRVWTKLQTNASTKLG